MNPFYKKLSIQISACVISSMLILPTAFADTNLIKDVEKNHWAYKSIEYVIKEGAIVGDFEGNFKPNSLIDKFEASRILAKLSGYKLENATKEDELYYSRCLENNKAFLTQFSNKFKKWNSTYNKEIAYLLEKEILNREDLNQFIILDNDKKEIIKNINREETISFLNKIIGKSKEAEVFKSEFKFNDDGEITPNNKNAIYYMYNNGVIKGKADNNFKPKDLITRAEMAVLIDRSFQFKAEPTIFTAKAIETVTPPKTETTPKEVGITIETFIGTITKIHSSANAIEVVSKEAKYNDKALIVSKSATITIDGYIKTFADLKTDILFTGVIAGDEIISIDGATGLNSINYTTKDNNTIFKGNIVSTKISGETKTIDLERINLLENGDAIIDVSTYGVSNDLKIQSNDTPIEFGAIPNNSNSIVTIKDNIITDISIVPTKIESTGVILDKHYDKVSKIAVFTVETTDKQLYVLKANDSSKLYRKDLSSSARVKDGSQPVKWDEVRVGDEIDFFATNGLITQANCYGYRTFKEITIKEIFISNNVSKVTAADNQGIVKVYPINPKEVDVYTFRIGSKLRVKLNSMEIETAMFLIK